MALTGSFTIQPGENLAELFPGVVEYTIEEPYTVENALIRIMPPRIERDNSGDPKFRCMINKITVSMVHNDGEVGPLTLCVSHEFPMTIGDNAGDAVKQAYNFLKTIEGFSHLEDI
ncbi:hypothetical protein [Desulfovibrio inopinatus]|uniref:hypothetical protein n=1 Tax=Desulfovibrio inopinatus TaxID=102109 RepID=UPI000409F6BC|nr:hypothetical protein [Desulfovibrio inopinatus]